MWLSMKTGGQYTRYKGAEGEQPEGRDEKDEEYRNRVNNVNKMMEDDRKVIEGAQKANEPIYKQIDVSGLVTFFQNYKFYRYSAVNFHHLNFLPRTHQPPRFWKTGY